MAAVNEKKVAEGKEHLREAEKCMKTSLFKWKPDLDGASEEYGKAAIAFKNAKAYSLAIDSYLKQSDVQKQSGSMFHAAKSIEAAALLCKESGDFNKAADLIEQASDLYLENGSRDSAALTLDKAAKMVEQNLPDRAIQLFVKASDIAEAEERPHQSAEHIGRAARILIRLKRFEEAGNFMKRELDFYSRVDSQGLLNKLVMGLVLVHLHREDHTAADQAFQACLRYPGVAESEEAGPIQRLLDAYYERDQETVEQIAKSPLFKYMENEFTKLARDLKVPGGGVSKKSTASAAADDNDGEKLDLL